jgi:hypothetical protein
MQKKGLEVEVAAAKNVAYGTLDIQAADELANRVVAHIDQNDVKSFKEEVLPVHVLVRQELLDCLQTHGPTSVSISCETSQKRITICAQHTGKRRQRWRIASSQTLITTMEKRLPCSRAHTTRAQDRLQERDGTLFVYYIGNPAICYTKRPLHCTVCVHSAGLLMCNIL